MQKNEEPKIPCVDCLVLPMCIDESKCALINSCPRANKYLVREVKTTVHKLNEKDVTIHNHVMNMKNTKKLDKYFNSVRGYG